MAGLQGEIRDLIRSTLTSKRDLNTKQNLRILTNSSRPGSMGMSGIAERFLNKHLSTIAEPPGRTYTETTQTRTAASKNSNRRSRNARGDSEPLSDEQPHIDRYKDRYVYPPSQYGSGLSRNTRPPVIPHKQILTDTVDQPEDNKKRKDRNRRTTTSELSDEASTGPTASALSPKLNQTTSLEQYRRTALVTSLPQADREVYSRTKLASLQDDSDDLSVHSSVMLPVSQPRASGSRRTRSRHAVATLSTPNPGFSTEQIDTDGYDTIGDSHITAEDDPYYSSAHSVKRPERIRRKPVRKSATLATLQPDGDDLELTDVTAHSPLALKAATKSFQDHYGSTSARQDPTTRRRPLRALEAGTCQEQATVTAGAARSQAPQDEWKLSREDSTRERQLRVQQVAQQEQRRDTEVTLERMREWQDIFQAEEDGQIEADRVLAIALSGRVDAAENLRPATRRPSTRRSGRHHHRAQGTTYRSLAEASELSSNVMHPIPVRPIDQHLNYHSLPVTDPFSSPARDRATIFENSSQQVTQPRESPQANARTAHRRTTVLGDAGRQSGLDLETQHRQELNRSRETRHHNRFDQEHRHREDQEHRRDTIARQRVELDRQRRHAEERRSQELEASRRRVRRTRKLDCAVCSETCDPEDVYRFPCTHAYCRDCLTQSIQTAVESKSAFRCCRHRVKPSSASDLLPRRLVSTYITLLLELDTPNPVYCSRKRCSTFIPPARIRAGTADCPTCDRRTCTACRNQAHKGVCSRDRDGQALLDLGREKGWKACPGCGTLVERKSGCLHMTCRCGREFCYSCGRSSERCRGTCSR